MRDGGHSVQPETSYEDDAQLQTTEASVRALQSQKSVLCCVIDSPTSIVVSQETRDW